MLLLTQVVVVREADCSFFFSCSYYCLDPTLFLIFLLYSFVVSSSSDLVAEVLELAGNASMRRKLLSNPIFSSLRGVLCRSR